MKRKEREHLKDDPFQDFIRQVLEFLTENKKHIIIGVSAVIVLIIVIVGMAVIRSGSVAKDNMVYSQALVIKNDAKLDIDQKIEKLSQLELKSGISSSVKLIIAALHFEKSDFAKAKEVVDNFSGSSSSLIISEKKMLEAEILNATNKKKEALDLLNSMLDDPKSEIAKDFILLRMAKIQAKTGNKDTAIANLNKIVDDYPQSYYSYEARNLLKDLKK